MAVFILKSKFKSLSMKNTAFKHPQEYKDFVSKVCELSECEEKYLDTKIRKQEFVRARYLIILFRVRYEGLDYDRALSVFNMNRTSFYHCVNTVKKDYYTNKEYRERFVEIFEKYPLLIN